MPSHRPELQRRGDSHRREAGANGEDRHREREDGQVPFVHGNLLTVIWQFYEIRRATSLDRHLLYRTAQEKPAI